MNSVSSLVFYWYLGLTILAAIAPITIPFLDLLGGILLTWVVYLFFFLGCHSKLFPPGKPEPVPASAPLRAPPMGVVAIGAVGASLFAAKFYTGKTLSEVFLSLVLKASLYNDYQKYFADQDLGVFSIIKIPAILSMLYLKLAVIYSFIWVIILNKEFRAKNVCWLLVVTLAQLFFSVARGTSFELFEILLLLWFSLFLRKIVYQVKSSLINAQKLFFAAVMLLVAMLYSFNISARYSFGDVAACSTLDLCLDQDSALYQISAPLADFLFKISGYFTFGLFYTSKFMSEFWLSGPGNLLSLFWPFNSLYRAGLKSDFLCGDTVDCGASWVPDAISYILHLGYFNLMLFAFVLGCLARRLRQSVQERPAFVELAALYFIFLGMVSLPVGSFITASSSNILSFSIILAALFGRPLFRLYFKKLRAAKNSVLSW